MNVMRKNMCSAAKIHFGAVQSIQFVTVKLCKVFCTFLLIQQQCHGRISLKSNAMIGMQAVVPVYDVPLAILPSIMYPYQGLCVRLNEMCVILCTFR